MNEHDVFWKLEALSDRQLLERLGSVLGSSRRLMAELIAHLGEVEERRLHLAAACSSMFTYCLKLGMTEDEAYRRIEVARSTVESAARTNLFTRRQVRNPVMFIVELGSAFTTFLFLRDLGADAIKVGIGPGRGCHVRAIDPFPPHRRPLSPVTGSISSFAFSVSARNSGSSRVARKAGCSTGWSRNASKAAP